MSIALRRRMLMASMQSRIVAQVTIPANTEKSLTWYALLASGAKMLFVDWGDGTTMRSTGGYLKHTYAATTAARSMTVTIIGRVSYLGANGCGLTALDVSSNPALTSLNCYNNQLTALDVSSNPALTSLNCSGNQLTALDVSSNPALTSLNCSGNQLTAQKILGLDGYTRVVNNYQLGKVAGDYDFTNYTFGTTTGDLALETDGVVKVNASINRTRKYSVDWVNAGINSWSIKAARVDVYFPDGTVISDKTAYYEKIAQIVKDEELYDYPQLCKIHTPAFGLQETRDNYATHKVLLCDSGNNSLWQNGRSVFGVEAPTNHINWETSKFILKNYVTTPLIKCRIVVSPNASFYITVVSTRFTKYDNRQRVICDNGVLQVTNGAEIISQMVGSTTNQTEYIVQFDIENPVNQSYYGHIYCLYEDKYPNAEDPYETRVLTFEEATDE